MDHGKFIYDVVKYVHTFLIGTVLYITAVGLYQLFVKEIDFPAWLKVESTEELETNLIGVTVVVLAVNFMTPLKELNYGVMAQVAGSASDTRGPGTSVTAGAWESRAYRGRAVHRVDWVSAKDSRSVWRYLVGFAHANSDESGARSSSHRSRSATYSCGCGPAPAACHLGKDV